MNTIDWLLEPASPGVRYLALRDLVKLPSDDPELIAARQAAHTQGPIAAILAEMHPDGYWSKAGPGYSPKYFGTVWSIILLSQLGASVALDERIGHACTYLLEANMTKRGQFTISGGPAGTVNCLQGNLCEALVSLDCADPRLELAFEWMARNITGESVAPVNDRDAPLHYSAYTCGPLFACGANNKLSCAWGATKAMLAFSKLPAASRTPLIKQAIQQGIDFLLSVDPATAQYPMGYAAKPSGNWWKLGFPVFYITDLLQIVEALVGLGYGKDPRLANALMLIDQKKDAQGCWTLEYDYAGKTWVDFGPKKQPNKWVTLRAMRVLKAV